MVVKPQVPVLLKVFNPLLSHMWKIKKTRGLTGLILFTKNTRLALLHALSGEYTHKKVEGVPVFKDGFPKSLGKDLIKEISKDPTRIYLRLVLTILFFNSCPLHWN